MDIGARRGPRITVLAAGVACCFEPMSHRVPGRTRCRLRRDAALSEFPTPRRPRAPTPIQVTRLERGWRYLQADNQRNAEREFQAALKLQPSFHPAATGLGYLELARRDAKDAVTFFDRALETDGAYVPALVGRGQALLELGREGDALSSFEAAVKSDPSLTELQSRIAVLRFRAVQDNLTRAKAASDSGRLPEARAAYAQAIAASPDSRISVPRSRARRAQSRDDAAALEHFHKALSLEPSDAVRDANVGDILETQGDLPGALDAFEKARAIDPAEVPAERIAKLRDVAALAKLPAEYPRHPAAPAVSRADVAAMLAVGCRG